MACDKGKRYNTLQWPAALGIDTLIDIRSLFGKQCLPLLPFAGSALGSDDMLNIKGLFMMPERQSSIG